MHTITGDGLHGLASAFMLIQTGQFEIVAVEGHSKASNILTLSGITAYAQDPVINRPLRFNTDFIAGLEMNRYLHVTGTTREQCASVVVKNRYNALTNPLASYGANLNVNDILYGPCLSWPLGQRERSREADGAVVMVLASEKAARNLQDIPIWIHGVGWANGSASLENRDWGTLPYLESAAKMSYSQAGINNPNQVIDFAEIDDTYAYKELQSLEALGFCSTGEAGLLTQEGFTSPQGQLPVNVSGGSLGFGHLLDATGLARALEGVLQLRGEAGSRQINDAEVGLIQSWRGVPTTSAAVTIFSN